MRDFAFEKGKLMKKKILVEILRAVASALTAILGLSAVQGCTSVPFFIF